MESQAVRAAALDTLRPRTSWTKSLSRFIRKKPLGAFGGAVVILLISIAFLAPVVATDDPYVMNKDYALKPPSSVHFLGTDNLGRDLYSRIVWGARVSLGVGFTSMIIGVLLGTTLGLTAGYWGGAADNVIMRGIDILMAFPSLILALAITAFLGPSIQNVIIAIGITSMPAISRVMRSNVLSVKENQYIEAARSLGASSLRIVLRHVLPNIVATLIVYASIYLGYNIMAEASLSFLGMGTPPPTPSWGEMLSGSSRTYMTRGPWLAIFPGVALSLAVFGFNLFGDALRDVLDPRMRGT